MDPTLGVKATGRCVVSRKKKVSFIYSIPQRNNAELILNHSSAYPFKTRYSQVLCSHCHKEFEILSELKVHMGKYHFNADHKNVLYGLRGHLMKIDISHLECKLCRQTFLDINDLMCHFSQEHDLPVNFNASFGVLPYKYVDDHWVCVSCGKTYSNFNDIKRHTSTHFMNYNCEKCGTTFISYQALKDHQRQVKCYRTAYNPRNGRVLRPRSNAEIILQCSSAYPFRTWMSNLNCIFCRVKTRDPVFFRNHMEAEHNTYDVQTAFYKKMRKAFLNVDITDLKCKVCSITIDKFEDLIDHLKNDHNQPIKSDAQSGLLPFRLNDGSSWKCAICNNQFINFDALRKHTQSHFHNYVCDTCGEGFITESALIAHNKIPHENKYSCSRCKATFTSLNERSAHVKTKHTSKPYVCLCCDDKPRFSSWEMKKKHQLIVHNYGSDGDSYACTLCGKSFKSRSGKYNHMLRVHRRINSELNFICSNCSRSFTSQLFLDKHMAKKHTI
ncbi:zinc finger protein 585B [Papilio machaon]|uniref:zinc finger protein 585B n=1 Tax=Papilio machaon TaxID=76193 RepID=UPI001E6653B8|nr:zinc finger protein 585B [Papilio machaon]